MKSKWLGWVDPDGRVDAGRRSRQETTTGDEEAKTREGVDFVDASTRRLGARERARANAREASRLDSSRRGEKCPKV